MQQNALKDYLKQSKISQRAFAGDLDVREATVSDWTNGKAVPSSHMMLRIARKTNGAVDLGAWFPDAS